jgi:hypothetical protein
MLKRVVPEEIKGKIRGLKVFKSMDGCVFDFPEDSHKLFEEIIFNDKYHGINYTLSKAEELPELLETENVYGGNNNNNNNITRNGNSFGGNNNRGGNSFNGNGNRSFSSGANSGRNRADRMDIFLGNLSSNSNEQTIMGFLQSNNIDASDCDIRLVNDKESGFFKGFSFISCYDKAKFDSILKLSGKMINGRAVRINDANDKKN